MKRDIQKEKKTVAHFFAKCNQHSHHCLYKLLFQITKTNIFQDFMMCQLPKTKGLYLGQCNGCRKEMKSRHFRIKLWRIPLDSFHGSQNSSWKPLFKASINDRTCKNSKYNEKIFHHLFSVEVWWIIHTFTSVTVSKLNQLNHAM